MSKIEEIEEIVKQGRPIMVTDGENYWLSCENCSEGIRISEKRAISFTNQGVGVVDVRHRDVRHRDGERLLAIQDALGRRTILTDGENYWLSFENSSEGIKISENDALALADLGVEAFDVRPESGVLN